MCRPWCGRTLLRREKSPAGWIDQGSSPRRQVILVVEDQVVTRQMEKSILEAAGYRVITAENGLDAMEKLHEHQVDLV